jgi:MFS family permease
MVIPPALKRRPFLLLWLGLLISITGSQMQIWALYWHIRLITNQPIAVSGLGLVRFIPVLILSLFAGLIADRFNRQKLAIVTQIILGLVALAFGLLTYFEHITLWQIYALSIIQSIAITFDLPARQSLIPNLVPKEELPNAFSMNSISGNVGAILGPALSGLVIAYIGLQWVYWLNAISYIAVVIALIVMGPVPTSVEKKSMRVDIMAADIREGIRFIRQSPIILSSMILDFFASFFSSANTLLPFVAKDILHVGAIQYGWLSAAQSMGDVSVALVVSQKTKIIKQGIILSVAVMIFGGATVIFGLSTGFWLTMAALILMGAADGISTIIRNTVRQLQTPDELRGRMVSINQIFFKGGPQLGEMESGLMAQAFSVPVAIITGGLGCIVAAGLVLKKFPQLIHYDGEEPEVSIRREVIPEGIGK